MKIFSAQLEVSVFVVVSVFLFLIKNWSVTRLGWPVLLYSYPHDGSPLGGFGFRFFGLHTLGFQWFKLGLIFLGLKLALKFPGFKLFLLFLGFTLGLIFTLADTNGQIWPLSLLTLNPTLTTGALLTLSWTEPQLSSGKHRPRSSYREGAGGFGFDGTRWVGGLSVDSVEARPGHIDLSKSCITIAA